MCRDFTEDDIREVWNSNLSDAQKRFVTAGIVIATAKKYKLHCVLVGGAAVEYYGHANYATSDIDIVTVDDVNEKDAMTSLGFRREVGRYWEIDGLPVAVEFPRAPLAGDIDRVTNDTVYVDGTPCNVDVISLEDLLVDRCGNWTVNNRPRSNELENPDSIFEDLDDVIFYLMDAYEDRIDWDYLMEQARLQSEDCHKVARHFKGYFKNIRGKVSPKNPRRKEVFKSSAYKEYLSRIMNYDGGGNRNADIFMSLAKPLITEDDFAWSERKDNVVFSSVVKMADSSSTCRKIMFSSPSCFGLDNFFKAMYVNYFVKKFHWGHYLERMEQKG